jgi:hypothetical protein
MIDRNMATTTEPAVRLSHGEDAENDNREFETCLKETKDSADRQAFSEFEFLIIFPLPLFFSHIDRRRRRNCLCAERNGNTRMHRRWLTDSPVNSSVSSSKLITVSSFLSRFF